MSSGEKKGQDCRVTTPLLWPPLRGFLSHGRTGNALSYTLRATTSSPLYCGSPRPSCHLSQCYQLPVGPDPMLAVSTGLNTNQQHYGQAEWQKPLSLRACPPLLSSGLFTGTSCLIKEQPLCLLHLYPTNPPTPSSQ